MKCCYAIFLLTACEGGESERVLAARETINALRVHAEQVALPCMERVMPVENATGGIYEHTEVCPPGQPVEVVWEPVPTHLTVNENGDWKHRGVVICRCPKRDAGEGGAR